MSEFDTVWKILKILDYLLGLFVTINSDQKLSIFQRIYQRVWMFGVSCLVILTTSTIFTNKTDIALVLQSVIILILYLSAFVMGVDLFMHKNRLRKILQWTKETQNIKNVHMDRARGIAAKTIKRLTIYFGFSCFSITFGMIILGQILPEEIYPRFRPPQPFELPVENRDNWTIYIITCTMQSLSIFYGQLVACYYYVIFITFCIIFYAFLNTILDDIYNLNDIGGTWAETSFGYSTQNELIIKQKMNEIVEKYCEAFSIFGSFTEQTSFFNIVTELDAFAVLLFTGMIFLVSSDNFLSIAVPMNVITCFFFMISLLNEIIQSKVDKIYEALYDLPWYGYSIKQKKHFLTLLQCNQMKMMLNSGIIHQVSLEQFGNIAQQAYSNILVIKQILELQK